MSKLDIDDYIYAGMHRRPAGVWHVDLGSAQPGDTLVLRTLSDKDINGALLCLDVWGSR